MGEWKPKRWFGVVLRILAIGLCFVSVGWLFGLIIIGESESGEGTGFGNFGPVGDYFGGMMAPFIGLIGAFLTFAAFYIQYQTNVSQNARLDKQEKDLEEQKERQRIDRFEQRFWDMLRIHRENAGTLKTKAKPFEYSSNQHIPNWGVEKEFTQNEIVKLYTTEFELIFKLHQLLSDKKIILIDLPFEIAGEASDKVFMGAALEIRQAKEALSSPIEGLMNPKEEYNYNDCLLDFVNRQFQPSVGNKFLKEFEEIYNKIPGAYNIPRVLGGYSSQLSKYFRHAYQMIGELDSFISPAFGDEEKKRFAKIFRAQLTDEEQRMFYYNSLGTAGKDWWTKGYITKYQLIKNVDLSQIPKEISPVLLLNDYLNNPGDAVLHDHLDRYLS
ncbi:MAG: putative phage abortive infection protein [Bacteroidetes bacterium]|nr:putative phage abortive infection protein [Bacteroidota bacterium]